MNSKQMPSVESKVFQKASYKFLASDAVIQLNSGNLCVYLLPFFFLLTLKMGAQGYFPLALLSVLISFFACRQGLSDDAYFMRFEFSFSSASTHLLVSCNIRCSGSRVADFTRHLPSCLRAGSSPLLMTEDRSSLLIHGAVSHCEQDLEV